MEKLQQEVGLLLADRDGDIIYADEVAAALLAHGAPELRRRRISRLLPGILDQTREAGSMEAGHAAITSPPGSPLSLRVEGPDGEIIPIVATLHEAPVCEGAGYVVTVASGEHDPEIDVYRDRLAMSAAIVEANLDALVTIDSSGRVIEFSPIAEKMFGYRCEDVLHRPLHELIIPPALRDAHCAGMQRYLETGEGPVLRKRIEISAMRADGSEFPVELTVTPIDLEDHTLFTAFIRDITDRKLSEEYLELAKNEADLANQAKTRFLATMSHEIRTPMTAVLGAIGMLLESDLADGQRNYALMADRAGRALLSIINDVLDFSRIESGQLELSHDEFAIANIIEESVDLLARRAFEKKLELATWMDPEIPGFLRGDGARLRQILINLLDNAVRFTECGAIAVRAKLVDQADDGARLLVRFEVQDTGRGIAEDLKTALFEEFFQIKRADGKDIGGSGLGLAICRRLVELFSGEIGVESDASTGSTFWFTAWLDVVTRREDRRQPQASADRLLVVWGNELARESLLKRVEDYGVMTDFAGSGHRALELIEERAGSGAAYDMVLLDDSLPDMTSKEFQSGIARLDEDLRPETYLLQKRTPSNCSPAAVSENWSGILTKPVTSAGLERLLYANPPQRQSAAGAPRPERRSDPGMCDLTGARLLLAEDSEANTIVIRAMLQSTGCDVDCVEDGRAALEAVQKNEYDLILMDLRMPLMDGYEATRLIRALDAPGSKIPIVAMTAGVVREELEGFLDAGANAYITKPVAKADLIEMVAKWLETSRRSRDIQQSAFETFEGEGADLVDHQILARLGEDTSPEAVPGMLGIFLKETTQRLSSVSEMVRDGNLKGLGEQAHAMKSSAGTFGAQRLHMLAKAVESACRENQREKALALARRLPDVAKNSMSLLETYL